MVHAALRQKVRRGWEEIPAIQQTRPLFERDRVECKWPERDAACETLIRQFREHLTSSGDNAIQESTIAL